MSTICPPPVTNPLPLQASGLSADAPAPVLRLARSGAGGSSRRTPVGSAARERNAARQPRVLVADDEAAIRLLCRVNLRLAGMEVLEANDGAAAIELARAEQPDILLLDVMMPEVDGWQVAAALAEDPATRAIPIVFLSARSELTDQRRGMRIGAVGYVTKPFDPLRLAPFLQELLERLERGEREQVRSERLDELGDER